MTVVRRVGGQRTSTFPEQPGHASLVSCATFCRKCVPVDEQHDRSADTQPLQAAKHSRTFKRTEVQAVAGTVEVCGTAWAMVPIPVDSASSLASQPSYGASAALTRRCRPSSEWGAARERRADGRRFEVQHIHWYRVRDGKITDHATNRTDLGMQSLKG